MSDLIWEREWPAQTSILVLAFAGYFDAALAATGAMDHLVAHTARHAPRAHRLPTATSTPSRCGRR